jgi:hypothetical protein
MLSNGSAPAKATYTAPTWANRFLGFGKELPRPLTVSLDVLRDGALLESYDLLEEFPDRFPTDGSANQQPTAAQEGPKVEPKLLGAIRLGKDKVTGADILCAHESISKLHCVLQVGINPALCVPTWKSASTSSTKSAAAILLRGPDEDEGEDEEESPEDLVSYVHLYDVGSSNGSYLIPGDGHKPQRLTPFRHFGLGNGALFRLGSSTRTYRVRWSLPLAGPISLPKVGGILPPQKSRKRTRSGESTSSDDDDDAQPGHIQISFSKKLEAKRELEEKGVQRMTQADLDALDDNGASVLAGVLPDASLHRMSYAELQRMKEKISNELAGDQTELEQHRQLNLRKQLNAIEGALIRLRDASIAL